MIGSPDLLQYLKNKFFGEDPLLVAGQMAKIVGLTHTLDDNELLTITVLIKPLKSGAKLEGL